MTDPQQIADVYRHLSGELFRVACGYVGITILTLALMTFYKKHQRELLWGAGIIMIVVIMALVLFGILNINNFRDRLIITLGIVCPGLYAYTAEKLYSKQQAKIVVQLEPVAETNPIDQAKSMKEEGEEKYETDSKETNAEQFIIESSEEEGHEAEDSNRVIIPPRLSTDLALEVFARAKADRFITERDGHFVWNGTKALLAYMCGRIYCEDKSEYEKATGINKWKQGKLTFPETALNDLFCENNLGQSRRSRELSSCPDGFRKIDSYFR